MIVRFIHNEPILEIDNNNFGLVRDRFPDYGWTELRSTKLENRKINEIDISLSENLEYRHILLEDLVYTYGSNSKKKKK
jgi:hypothetical protein